MVSQQTNEPRAFKVALIYMVEERTKEKIAELYQQLQTCGIEVFLFSKDMPTVESHEVEMHKQIEKADAVLICYSENFERGSGYRHIEVDTALKEQKKRPRGNAYLIPVRLDECNIPNYLGKIRVLDYFRRNHFDGIMQWGLAARRSQLIEEGQNIKQFNYNLPQQVSVALPPEKLPSHEPEVKHRQLRFTAEFPSIWNVPYRSHPLFADRKDILQRIREGLSSLSVESALMPQTFSGPAGIGKTRFATEYAFHYRSEYDAVLWIAAILLNEMAICVFPMPPRPVNPCGCIRIVLLPRWSTSYSRIKTSSRPVKNGLRA